jgi:tRNA(fMet)-specific endonuclease VapC
MRLAIDSNRYTDFCRGIDPAVEVIRRADELWVPFIVAAELRAGFRAGSRPRENEQRFLSFLGSPRVGLLWADEATTHFYAEIYADLRRAGTPIPTNDIWIAALTLQHGLILFTRDQHFEHIPRIARM